MTPASSSDSFNKVAKAKSVGAVYPSPALLKVDPLAESDSAHYNLEAQPLSKGDVTVAEVRLEDHAAEIAVSQIHNPPNFELSGKAQNSAEDATLLSLHSDEIGTSGSSSSIADLTTIHRAVDSTQMQKVVEGVRCLK